MAEEQATPDEGAAKPPKKGKLGMLIAGAAAGGLGFATPYVLPSQYRPGAPHAAETKPAHGTAADSNHELGIVPFGQVVANLNEGRLNRYLRVTISLQVAMPHKEEVMHKIEAQHAVMTNWLLSYFSDKELQEIRGAAGQNRLRREIQDQFNSVICPDSHDQIHQVLFEEFNIQ